MSIKRTIITTIVALAVVAMVAPQNVAAVTIDELLAQIAQLQAQLTSLQGSGSTTAVTSGACVGVTFSRNLTVGSTGSDVKCLQTILNNKGFTVAATGAGAPGAETTYFGAKTLVAVKKYQAAKGFTPANQVGPMTRNALTADMGTSGNGGTVITPVAGGLSVSTAADNPASANVANSSSADFTKFILSAGSGAVTVNRLYVTRTGLSTNNAVSNIKIVDAATGSYVGSIGSLNSNNQALIVFTQGLTIPAGTSKEFIIRASAGTSTYFPAGNTVALGINGTDITSNATSVTGSVSGNMMSSVNITIGTLTVAEDGSTVDSAPQAGDKGVILNQFTLAAGSTEDVTVSAVTVMKTGTISNANVGNFTLYDVTKGTTLGTAAALNADGRATFSNLNLVIAKGATERLRVTCDIIGGNSADTVNADIIDGSDTTLVVVKGNTYGFYITPTSGWTGGFGSNRGTGTANQTLQTSGLTISKSSLTPATGNTSAGADKTLAVLDFNAVNEPVKISSLKLTTVQTGTAGTAGSLGCTTSGSEGWRSVTAVKIYDENGTIVAGPQDLTGSDSTASGSVTFTDTFIVPVGTHHYTIKAKLSTSVLTSDTIKIGIATGGTTDVTATGMLNNDTISASGSSIYGNVMTVKGAALTVTTNNTPVGKTITTGAQGVVWATFNLSAASSGEDVQVTSLTLTDAGTATNYFTDFANLALYTGTNYATRISQIYNPGTAAATQAFPLTTTLTVPVGGYVTVAMIGDLKTGATNSTNHVISIANSGTPVTANGASTGTSLVRASTYTVTATGAQTMAVSTTGGSLTVSKDSNSPVADLITAGSTNTLAIFKLYASNVEDLAVNEINLTVTGGADVASYTFYKSTSPTGTLTQLGSSVAGGTSPDLILNTGDLTVPAAQNMYVTVKATMQDVDGSIIVNNDTVTATVQGVSKIKATGLGSGSVVTASSNQDAIGGIMKLVKSKPVFTVDSASPSGTNQVGSAAQTVAIFDVTNQGTDDVVFTTGTNLIKMYLSRSLASSNSTSRTWTLKDETGTELSQVTNFSDATNTSVTFSTWDNVLRIAPGQTKKLYVIGDTSEYTSTTTTRDSLQVYLSDATVGDLNYSSTILGSTATGIDAATYVFRNSIYAGRLSY